MKNNCKVKVKFDDRWHQGTLLNAETLLVGVGEPYYFNYEKRTFEPHEVKEYVELEETVAEKTHAEQLLLAFEMAKEALNKLMPTAQVKIKEGSLECGSLTMDPVVHDVQTIGKFIEVPAWQVTAWEYHYATHWQPEECYDCPIEEPLPYPEAVKLFVKCVLLANADDYWQAKTDDEWAKNMEIPF